MTKSPTRVSPAAREEFDRKCAAYCAMLTGASDASITVLGGWGASRIRDLARETPPLHRALWEAIEAYGGQAVAQELTKEFRARLDEASRAEQFRKVMPRKWRGSIVEGNGVTSLRMLSWWGGVDSLAPEGFEPKTVPVRGAWGRDTLAILRAPWSEDATRLAVSLAPTWAGSGESLVAASQAAVRA